MVHKVAEDVSEVPVVEIQTVKDDGRTTLTEGRFLPFPKDRALVGRFHPKKITPVSSNYDFVSLGMTVMNRKVKPL